MDLCIMSAPGFVGLARAGAVGADGTDLEQKYPGFAGSVHQYLQDIFGDKKRPVSDLCNLSLSFRGKKKSHCSPCRNIVTYVPRMEAVSVVLSSPVRVVCERLKIQHFRCWQFICSNFARIYDRSEGWAVRRQMGLRPGEFKRF